MRIHCDWIRIGVGVRLSQSKTSGYFDDRQTVNRTICWTATTENRIAPNFVWRAKVELPSRFSISFDQVMDPDTVNNLSASFELRSAGPNEQFDDDDDVLIPLRTRRNAYDYNFDGKRDDQMYLIGTNQLDIRTSNACKRKLPFCRDQSFNESVRSKPGRKRRRHPWRSLCPPVSTLSLQLVSRGSTLGLVQSIELFNNTTREYEIVDQRPVSRSDAMTNLSIADIPERFINLTNGEIRAKFSVRVPFFALSSPWNVAIDHAGWVVD